MAPDVRIEAADKRCIDAVSDTTMLKKQLKARYKKILIQLLNQNQFFSFALPSAQYSLQSLPPLQVPQATKH
jgi:hypothetical protein